VQVIVTDTPEAEVASAPPGAFFLVMTHSHPLDEALAECILRRGDFAYFGLIGSVSKRRQFEKRLEARGMTKERLAAMTCPLGSTASRARRPAVIAIAVAAEVLSITKAPPGRRSAAPPRQTPRTPGACA
jgi:xanthine dehydrogenase accessory factor